MKKIFAFITIILLASIPILATCTAGVYTLSVSNAADRSNAVALQSAPLSGSVYVFTSPANQIQNSQPSGITKVCFWLDNPTMSGTANQCETNVPFDFKGTNGGTTISPAFPWDTTTVSNGSHNITQQVTFTSNWVEVDTSSFTVLNNTIPITINTTSLPAGFTNTVYSTTLSASGGVPPYSWSLVSGSLPSGLTLSTGGVISGTAGATTGNFSFIVQVSDTQPTSAQSGTLTISISSTVTSSAKFFSPTSFINTPIASNAALNSPNNTGTVISPYQGQAHLSNGAFGSALNYVNSANSTVISVNCNQFGSSCCDQNHNCNTSVQFPIPRSGVVIPSGSDGNAAFVDTDTTGPYAGLELDCWGDGNSRWSGGSPPSLNCGTVGISYNMATSTNPAGWGTCAGTSFIPNFHCNIGYAAGLLLMAGPVRPEEIQAGLIPHALVFASPASGQTIICPATHTDSGFHEGSHYRLPTSLNIDGQSWPAWVKVVAHAAQTYGMYCIDISGAFEIKGITDPNPGVSWTSVGVPVDNGTDLNMVPWNTMVELQETSCN